MLIGPGTNIRISQILEVMQASMSLHEIISCTPLTASTRHGVNEFQEFLDVLRNALQQRDPTIIIAKDEETLVGFAYYQFEHNSIRIEELHVKKPYQHRGVGTCLLHYIEQIAQDNQISTLRTRTPIMRGGVPWKALKFWTYMGFAIQNPSRIPTLHFIELQKHVLIKNTHLSTPIPTDTKRRI